jgi:hypothetical protein
MAKEGRVGKVNPRDSPRLLGRVIPAAGTECDAGG